MSSYTDQEILEAINQLSNQLQELLPDSDAQQLGSQLDDLLDQAKDPGRESQVTTKALELIREYPAVRDELKMRLIRSSGFKSETRLGMAFEPMPGHGDAIEPGERVVCPIDPTHLIKRLRVKGELCPQHHVELVPESSITILDDKDEK